MLSAPRKVVKVLKLWQPSLFDESSIMLWGSYTLTSYIARYTTSRSQEQGCVIWEITLGLCETELTKENKTCETTRIRVRWGQLGHRDRGHPTSFTHPTQETDITDWIPSTAVYGLPQTKQRWHSHQFPPKSLLNLAARDDTGHLYESFGVSPGVGSA